MQHSFLTPIETSRSNGFHRKKADMHSPNPFLTVQLAALSKRQSWGAFQCICIPKKVRFNSCECFECVSVPVSALTALRYSSQGLEEQGHLQGISSQGLEEQGHLQGLLFKNRDQNPKPDPITDN